MTNRLATALVLAPAGAILCAAHGLAAADSALCRRNSYRERRDRVLASIFGPEQHFEFVGTTAPSAAP